MDQAALAGHATELGYFDNYDTASTIIKSTGQAAFYKNMMISDLNAIYTAESLSVAMSLASGGVTVAGDPVGSAATVVGKVYSRIGVLGDVKSLYGFASSARTFNNFMSDSPSFGQQLTGIDHFSGQYYAENCERLKCF
jgi:hypothetical protein